jgi:cobalt-zinc-cadmium efflux system protein
LLALTIWVLVEAARRLLAPPDVNGGLMLAVAAVGAAANIVAYLLLSGASPSTNAAHAHT